MRFRTTWSLDPANRDILKAWAEREVDSEERIRELMAEVNYVIDKQYIDELIWEAKYKKKQIYRKNKWTLFQKNSEQLFQTLKHRNSC